MPITLPSNVAPNELIQSAWGNSVVDALDELDTEKLDKAGGTMTASLFMNQGLIRSGRNAGAQQFQAVDTNNGLSVTLAFYGNGSSITGPGALSGYVGYAGSNLLRLQNDIVGANTMLSANGDIILRSIDTERMRLVSTALLFGKTATDLTGAGLELFGTGSSVLGMIASTTSAASIRNGYWRHAGSADANTEAFHEFVRAGGAVVGSITQVSTTGVAYNTTSDARLKEAERELDDDETAEILRRVEPKVYEFTEDPGVQHIGFLAQQLAEAWPSFVDVGIVTPGYGEPGDEPEMREVVIPVLGDDGSPVLGDDGKPMQNVTVEQVSGTGFRPWQIDASRLVPVLVAGWQQLDRRLTALESS